MSKIKVFIAGHSGMVGSACLRRLGANPNYKFVLRSSKELDLRNQSETYSFFKGERPQLIILAAARVGGIQANIDSPASFLYDNLMIQANVIEASRQYGSELVINIGSSCIYPRECPQPMKEGYLLDGKLEPTNEGYALAKIVGLKLISYYKKQFGFNAISIMPCNLYGRNDSFDLRHSHVLSALVKRFSDAVDDGLTSISLWGSGNARREFMNVDDVARAIEYFINNPFNDEFVNVGWGIDVSIKELAAIIANKTNFKGEILWDTTKPDGMPRKCMDVSKMKSLGFQPIIDLDSGIDQMIELYHQIKSNSVKN